MEGISEETDYIHTYPDFSPDDIAGMKKGDKDGDNTSDCSSTAPASSKPSNLSSKGSSKNSYDSAGTHRNIWSKMTQRGVWAANSSSLYSEEAFADEHMTFRKTCSAFWRGVGGEIAFYFKTIRQHPYILLYIVLVFCILVAAALAILQVSFKRHIESLKNDAMTEAYETAAWFSDTFAKTLIPLRSLQQAVMYSEYFKPLHAKIGPRGVEGSAPAIFGPTSTTIADYRNLTGICDDEEMKTQFREIVNSITKNFEMEGIIVNYRLAPYGVFCVIDPMVNTVDFEDGAVFDSTAVLGWDQVYSEKSMFVNMVHKIYSTENHIELFGPMENGAMKEFFCGHLSVDIPGYELIAQGQTYNSWGFVMHFINWERLKNESNIYSRFTEKGLLFNLVRVDDPGTDMEREVTLAHSSELSIDEDGKVVPRHKINLTVSIETQTPNGLWRMYIWNDRNLEPTFLLIRLATIIGSLFVTVLFALLLVERHQHKLLLYKIMPKTAIEKLNRGHTVVERYNIVTIFFSDIVGFTSLAGELSPIRVMEMLNELYNNFDKIAKKHNVYKVETIGDAYMVVGGAPDRCSAPEAAQKVAVFALEVTEFVKNFKTIHGNRIQIRCGLASGPVVAGVVGSSMPRFCFFGDTVNFASRMESTSQVMKIQCNDFTARLLRDAPNFSFSLSEREENGVRGVLAKGKGVVRSWWIECVDGVYNQKADLENPSGQKELNGSVDSTIQSIALTKQTWERLGQNESSLVAATPNIKTMADRIYALLEYRLSLAIERRPTQNPLSTREKAELRNYVHTIASLHNSVEFHSFEHVSHVTISMNKVIDTISSGSRGDENQGSIYDNLWSDVFTHFAMLFSAMIHDVAHTGQSNKILETIQHDVAIKFTDSSAERNSIDVALNLLNEQRFKNIRKAIMPTAKERVDFGKVVFWALLCTDIASPSRLMAAKSRFDAVHEARGKAELMCSYEFDKDLCPVLPYFYELTIKLKLSEKDVEENKEDLCITAPGLERCVTVEHLMQVSDVAHLMQSFDNFVKWNFRLYKELMACFKKGLMSDPTENWAIGQIGFLENYIIPLAERTEKICGSSIASLNLSANARANKTRWEEEGEVITAIFVSGYSTGDLESDVLLNALNCNSSPNTITQDSQIV